jgi:UDP-N-acetylglucosamine acyltransferase
MAPSANIGGHCSIFESANLGMAAVVHQRVKIGAGCMVGMNSTVTKDAKPFQLWYGSPARNHGLNTRLLRKMLFTDKDIRDLQYFYKKNKKMPSFVVEYINQMKDS